ncbi:RNA polymerase subunit sigma [Mycobacterium sp. EPG1]|nr:RNA polymerase subunit sigma [Mycobacterium sp. EPG1]
MPEGTDELHARFLREAVPLADRLAARALSLTRDRHDAEDLLQETMLFAYNGFHSYQDGTNLRAWLMRIMHNRWVSQCRRRASRPETSVGDFTDDSWGDAVAVPSAETSAMAAMFDGDLHTALMGLQDDTRTVVFYVYFADLPHQQVARLLGVPAGTVMSRAHRGRRQLRATLADLARRASAA